MVCKCTRQGPGEVLPVTGDRSLRGDSGTGILLSYYVVVLASGSGTGTQAQAQAGTSSSEA